MIQAQDSSFSLEGDVFQANAAQWWNPEGAFASLHQLNPVRVRYVRDAVARMTKQEDLRGLSLLDIGCGGGLLTEPLCRLGAVVTGLDTTEASIDVARDHARRAGLKIAYHTCTAETFAARHGATFDVITALEVLEHVENPHALLTTLAAMLNPDGVLIVATLNRTVRSFLFAIVAAEDVLGWVPRGTHDWRQFITPHEMSEMLISNGLTVVDTMGVIFNPLSQTFQLSTRKTTVNYMMTAYRGKNG